MKKKDIKKIALSIPTLKNNINFIVTENLYSINTGKKPEKWLIYATKDVDFYDNFSDKMKDRKNIKRKYRIIMKDFVITLEDIDLIAEKYKINTYNFKESQIKKYLVNPIADYIISITKDKFKWVNKNFY